MRWLDSTHRLTGHESEKTPGDSDDRSLRPIKQESALNNTPVHALRTLLSGCLRDSQQSLFIPLGSSPNQAPFRLPALTILEAECLCLAYYPNQPGALQSQRIIYIPSAYTNFPFSLNLG